MFVYFQSPETVFNKSAMRYVISSLKIGLTDDGSVRILDRTPLADTMEASFNNFAVNL